MTSQRTCYSCKEVRPLSMFYIEAEKRRAATLGRTSIQHMCRLCSREVAVKRMAPRRAIIDEARAVGCADCGVVNLAHPEIFDFDHLPGHVKLGSVTAFLTKGSIDDLRAEIAKCEVVCSNCHRIRTKSREAATFGVSRVVI
jgi:hypothetical protein